MKVWDMHCDTLAERAMPSRQASPRAFCTMI